MAELESGQSLTARFTLVRQLGRGGMGDVWLARDEELGAPVVVKTIAATASPDQIALLRQECRNARRLSHPNIVRVFDFHQDPSATFITMEYVEGGDLCQFHGQPPEKVVELVLPLVGALEYAHAEGVIHRDLKCSNVLVDVAGRPRLSDFGIASVVSPGADDLLLAGGGSPNHASPQQKAGEPASPADDVFGLGALLAEVLGTTRPLGEPLGSLLRSMMAAEVVDRPPDVTAVRTVLEESLELGIAEATAPPLVVRSEIRLSPPPRVPPVRHREPVVIAPSPEQFRAEPKRHPYWWLTVAVFLVLAITAVAVVVWLPGWVEQRAAVSEEPRVPIRQDAPASPVPAADPEPVVETPTPAGAETVIAVAELASEPPDPLLRADDEPPSVPPDEPEVRAGTTPSARPRAPQVDRQSKEFATAMSAGLSAADDGDLQAAKAAFERALALRPESVEAADGLTRAEQGLRLIAIRSHQTRAAAAEGEEKWLEAEREYSAALVLDSTLRFAQEGKDRAAARAALDKELEFHLSHVDRLSEDAVLERARGALAQARAIEPATSRLRDQVERLQSAIKIATTPIQVVLVSDNLTQVVVYRVGRLGTFDQRALDLRPGTYTVVGTREGYRDVRRRLVVAPEGGTAPLTVRCEEKI